MSQASDTISNSERKMFMRRDSAGWYEPSADEGVDEGADESMDEGVDESVDESSGPQSDTSCEWPASDDSQSQSQSPGSLPPRSSSPGSLEDKRSQHNHSPLNEHTAGTLPHDAAPQQLKTVAQHEEVACILQVDSMMDSNIAEGKISSDPSTPHTLDSASLDESSSGAVTVLPRSIPGLVEYFARDSLPLKSQWSSYRTLVDPTTRWFQTHGRRDRSLYSSSTIFFSSVRSWLVATLLAILLLVFIPWVRPLKSIPFAPPTCVEIMNPGDSMSSILEVGDDSLWAMIHASRLNSLPAARYTRNTM